MNKALNFDTGNITVHIQGDPNRPLTFNPKDYNMAGRFFDLVKHAEEKQKEFIEKAKVVDESNDTRETVKLLKDMDTYFRGELDEVFGEGASAIIFEDINVATTASNGDTVLANFLMALYPYFKKASDKKVSDLIQDHKPKQKKKKK